MIITAAINKDLLDWFKDMPSWQHEAFRRILTKGKCTPSDLDELYAHARQELGLDAKSGKLPAKLTDYDLPVAPKVEAATTLLTSLHSLSHVNRLSTDQRLDFGPALTVIYGGNGAGKSGLCPCPQTGMPLP